MKIRRASLCVHKTVAQIVQLPLNSLPELINEFYLINIFNIEKITKLRCEAESLNNFERAMATSRW